VNTQEYAPTIRAALKACSRRHPVAWRVMMAERLAAIEAVKAFEGRCYRAEVAFRHASDGLESASRWHLTLAQAADHVLTLLGEGVSPDSLLEEDGALFRLLDALRVDHQLAQRGGAPDSGESVEGLDHG